MLPTELDMTEEFGLTTPRAKHVLAIPTYSLHKWQCVLFGFCCLDY